MTTIAIQKRDPPYHKRFPGLSFLVLGFSYISDKHQIMESVEIHTDDHIVVIDVTPGVLGDLLSEGWAIECDFMDICIRIDPVDGFLDEVIKGDRFLAKEG